MRKIFSLAIAMGLANLAMAQMHVSSGSYVYVTDQVVYVENDVDLQSNGIVYLRDEAQLVQGHSGATGNTGTGYVSLNQEGTTNVFHYNFWAAPVGTNGVSSSANNDYTISMLRDDTGSSVGFTHSVNGTSSPFAISRWWLYTYDNGTLYADWDLVSETDAIAPGLGYTMKGAGGAGSWQGYEFRGKPNDGFISHTINPNELLLIGNPYPSALDADQFILDNAAGTNGTLYFWDQWGNNSHYLEDYEGNYATYTSSGLGMGTGVAATTPTTDDGAGGEGDANGDPRAPRRYVPIAQGFFVEGNGTGGSVTIQNSQRPNGSADYRTEFKESIGSEFLRSASQNRNYYLGPNVDFPVLVFNINVDDTFNRKLLLALRDDANETAEYGKEAKLSDGALATDAVWTIGNEDYVIQSDAFSIEKRIPIQFNAAQQTEFEVSIEATENISGSFPVYLYDTLTDEYFDLVGETQSITLNAGTYADRYEIVFEQQHALSTENFTSDSFTVFQNNDLAQLSVRNPEALDIKKLSLYDVAGKLILNKENLGSQVDHNFNTSTFSAGVYIVNIITKENNTFTKKITISN